VTPGITAPRGSDTVPEMVPVMAAWRGIAIAKTLARGRILRRDLFTIAESAARRKRIERLFLSNLGLTSLELVTFQ
jgi:hypothetical protein